MAAVHVVGRGAGRQIHVAELEVGAEHRPDVRHPGVLPRVVEPRLHARLSGPRDGAPRPAQRAGAHVVGADVARVLLHGERMVGHCAAQNHHVLDHQRRRRARVAGLGVVGQVDQARVAERVDQLARSGVDRHQVGRANREDPPFIVRFPPGDAPVRRAARRLVPEEGRILHPEGLARARVERLHQADAVRRVEHAVDHDRRRAELVRVAQLRPALAERRVDRLAPPHDLQVAYRLRVDLIQCRIARVAGVAAVDAPFAAHALLGLRRGRAGEHRDQQENTDGRPVGRACHRTVCHSFVSALVSAGQAGVLSMGSSRHAAEHDCRGRRVLQHQGHYGRYRGARKRLAAALGEHPEIRHEREQQGDDDDSLE